MNKIIRLFLDVNMVKSHTGLKLHAQEHGVDLDKLSTGEHAVFINEKMNRVKIYSYNKVLSYLWKEKGRIDMNAFKYISTAFNPDGSISFDKALKKSLTKRLAKKPPALQKKKSALPQGKPPAQTQKSATR